MTIIEALVQLRNDLKLWVSNNLRMKVDKEDGKGLSSNDFTDEYKDAIDNIGDGTIESTKFADTAIRKWRHVVDSRLSPWHLEINNIEFSRTDFVTFKIASTEEGNNTLPASDITEILIGTVTFYDNEYGYIIYDVPQKDGIHFELRCGDDVYQATDGYTINKNTNPFWESKFKDKTYEIYMVIDKGFVLGRWYSFSGESFVYECMSMHDMEIGDFADSADSMFYRAINSKEDKIEIVAQNETINGVTFVVDGDIITANGTATDDIVYVYGQVDVFPRTSTGMLSNITVRMECGDAQFGLQIHDYDNYEVVLPGYYMLDQYDHKIDNIYHPFPRILDSEYMGELCDVVILIKAGTVFDNTELWCKMSSATRKLKDVVQDLSTKTYKLNNMAGFADTSIKKWRSALDSRLSPWYLETNNIIYSRKNFETIQLESLREDSNWLPVTETTEILLGTITFTDCEYGYMYYDIPNIDGIRFESRCDGKVYNMKNGYTINKYTNSLWETDFKDKTHEIYIIIKQGFVNAEWSSIRIKGIAYECISMHEHGIGDFDDAVDMMCYEWPEDRNSYDQRILAESTTINGVQFTVNDNIVVVNGTAEDDIEYEYGLIMLENRSTTSNTETDRNNYRIDKPLSSSDYFIGLQIADVENGGVLPGYYILDSSNTMVINDICHPIISPYSGSSNILLGNVSRCKIVILIRKGTTFENKEIYCNVRTMSYPLNMAVQQTLYDVDDLKLDVSEINNKLDNGQLGKTLTQHFAEENMVLSNLQYGDELPEPGTPGRVFFKRVIS